MTAEVRKFPSDVAGSTVEEALEIAGSQNFESCVIIGEDEDGSTVIVPSRTTRQQLLWMAKRLEEFALYGEQ